MLDALGRRYGMSPLAVADEDTELLQIVELVALAHEPDPEW